MAFLGASGKSTLSLYQRRSTKYQKFLNLSNVFLLITSTILIFSAIILIKFYHIDHLTFWSAYFCVVPHLMIALGVYTFVICVFGFSISNRENRVFLVIYAILLSIAFFAQLASIFTALELRTTVTRGEISSKDLNDNLALYGEDAGVTADWDDLQKDLHCCGGQNFGTGYADWRNTPIGRNDSVPDSCCHSVSKGCGKDVHSMDEAGIRRIIFVDGCVTLLKSSLEADVVPMMIVYAIVGVVLAITELVTIVLACAYIAQITRKLRKEENWRHGTADHDGNGGGGENQDETDRLNHETVC